MLPELPESPEWKEECSALKAAAAATGPPVQALVASSALAAWVFQASLACPESRVCRASLEFGPQLVRVVEVGEGAAQRECRAHRRSSNLLEGSPTGSQCDRLVRRLNCENW